MIHSPRVPQPPVKGLAISSHVSDPLPPRLSISDDSIRVQAMQLMMMGHGSVAPPTEALEHEFWGVSWGVRSDIYP